MERRGEGFVDPALLLKSKPGRHQVPVEPAHGASHCICIVSWAVPLRHAGPCSSQAKLDMQALVETLN